MIAPRCGSRVFEWSGGKDGQMVTVCFVSANEIFPPNYNGMNWREGWGTGSATGLQECLLQILNDMLLNFFVMS